MALIPPRGDSGFTLGGFLILALLGTFLWKGAPLDSVRPGTDISSIETTSELFQVPARLWQDPFKVAAKYTSSMKSAQWDDTAFAVMEKRSLEKLKTAIGQATSDRVTILLAMMSPGAYAELEEQRRRRRYAVISGLGEESFVPDNSEVLNVFYHKAEGYSYSNPASTPKTYAVAYEWFHHEDEASPNTTDHRVVLLWLDESRFAPSPLDHTVGLLSLLLDGNAVDRENIDVALLGPGRSDALRNLVNKQEKRAYSWLAGSGLSGFSILSSTATVDNADLVTEVSNTDGDGGAGTDDVASDTFQRFLRQFEAAHDDSPEAVPETARCVESGFTRAQGSNLPCMRFLRTIQSDKTLIELLRDELIDVRGFSRVHDRIILISESDTYFGRSLPRAFTSAYCGTDATCRSNLITVTYQRGLDGIVTGNDSSSAGGKSNATMQIEEKDLRRPTGTAQYDYLRRLAGEIGQKNDAWRYRSGHDLRAVVLLGSDVYDKLLILRALRTELPGVLFITTDLNTQFLHPAEYNWARNLIIATTYDLVLSGNVPTKTMPMRDSYQTSTHLATRLLFNEALRKDSGLQQATIYDRLPPQLLEVGRSELIKLNDGIDADDTWNHIPEAEYHNEAILAAVIFTLLIIFAFHQLKPNAGREIVVLAIISLSFFILTLIIASQDIIVEPADIFSGTSAWPTVYIRLFSIIMSVVFIWWAVFSLQGNWKQLDQRYFSGGPVERDDGISTWQAFKDLLAALSRPFRERTTVTYSKVASVLMIVTLMLMMSKVMPMPMGLADKLIMLAIIWIILIGLWWAHIYGWLFAAWKRLFRSDREFHVRSVNQWRSKCEDRCHSMNEMWQLYGEYGSGENRFMRTIAYVLIYFAFASFVFTMLGAPESPCRGDFACTTNRAVLGLAVLSMLVLLFLVVDAARLCICWVGSLSSQQLNWDNSRLRHHVQKLKLPEDHARAWILVHLIGERTDVVTRLIYYPVIIILLMILSRSTYFDDWDFPQALAIITTLNFVIALGSVVVLNFVALAARKEILRKLEEEQIAGDREEATTYSTNTSERRELIDQLSHLQTGAYLPVWQQPPVRATLMLLGGFALTFAEYFNIFVQ